MSGVTCAVAGRISELSRGDRQRLLRREGAAPDEVRRSTAEIVDTVRRRGDDALHELAQRFDGVRLASLEVPMSQARNALDAINADVRRALEHACANIQEVHRAFLPAPLSLQTRDGVAIVRRPDPLARVGVYAPGGRAAYPSSVLMSVVPARVAGVQEIVVCSPPDMSGTPSDLVLAAAALSGATRIFALGGAGAIAAMAYGTVSVPAVDRIVGPGNAYVACAKQMVASLVGIDSPAGPSELLIVADGITDARRAAWEILAQAEHDPAASVIVVSTSEAWLKAVASALNELIADQPRAPVIAASLANCGAMLHADTLDEALDFARDVAPEHLLVLTANAEHVAARATNAGTIFIGESSSVTFGDYITGANHVLPTAGLARSYSGLSTSDFVRWTTVQRVDAAAAARLANDAGTLAAAEGLSAHAAAALQWRRG